MTISVIIPVHNSSATLERCVNSVLNQTYKNLEVILVENGSRDASLQMCKDYAAKDSRVKVLSLQTSGISKARNAGLDIKTGEYFAFVDSDDYLEADMFEKLFTKAESEHADMTFCRYTNIMSDGKVLPCKEKRLEELALEYKIESLLVYGENRVETCVWRILFKAKVFGGLRFNERMIYLEDADYLFKALTLSTKNAVVPEHLYNYIYLYDKTEIRRDKYYRNVDAVIETCKNYIISTREFCDNKNYGEFAKAVTYLKYVETMAHVLHSVDYRKIIKSLKNDDFWKNVNTKENYKQFKKHYSGRKLRLKAYLVRTKQYALYRFLDKLSKTINGK